MNPKLRIVLECAGALLLVIAVVEIVHQRELQIRAEDTAHINDAVNKARADAMAERDKADAVNQQNAQKAQAAISTTPQAVKIITQYVPVPASATQPNSAPVVTVQKPDLPAQVQNQLPDSPSYAVMTQEQSVLTARKLIQCDADSASLTACKLDRAALQESLAAETETAKKWEIAAKGGTKWQRIWGTTKKVGIGILIGAAAGYAAHR